MVKKFTPRTLLIALCALSFISLSRAADPGIGVTLLDYTLDSANQNSVDLGYTITIYAQITNFDSVPFRGTINFGLHNNHLNLTGDNIFNTPPYSGDIIDLDSGETVPAIFSVTVSPKYFIPGPDVVVVWPISNLPVSDSIIIHLNVLDPSGISNTANPSVSYSVLNDKMLVKSLNTQTDFKQVRIFNAIGQVILQIKSDAITEVPLSNLPGGIYFCEFLSSDGKRNVIKFFH